MTTGEGTDLNGVLLFISGAFTWGVVIFALAFSLCSEGMGWGVEVSNGERRILLNILACGSVVVLVLSAGRSTFLCYFIVGSRPQAYLYALH